MFKKYKEIFGITSWYKYFRYSRISWLYSDIKFYRWVNRKILQMDNTFDWYAFSDGIGEISCKRIRNSL